MEKRLRW